MSQYNRLLKSLAMNANNRKIESEASGGTNYYTTGATLGGNNILTGSTQASTWTADLSALAAVGTIGGSITDNQIAIGATTANSIEGANTFKWDASTLTMTNAGNTAITVLGNSNRSSSSSHAMAMRGMWDGTAIGTVMIQTGPDTTNKDDGRIVMYTASAGTQAERMTILHDGNVGIGTTSPTRKLHVYSSDNMLANFESSGDTAMIRVSDNDTDGQIGVKDGKMFLGYSASMTTNNLVLTNINDVVKVGIGTIAPAYNLDVVGTTQLSGNSSIVGTLSTTGVATLGNNSVTNTQTAGNNSTRIATTAFVTAAVAANTGTPGGSDTQVQFNDGGSFGADAGLTYVKGTDTLTAGAYNLENLDDQLTWAGRNDLLIQGTTSYDMELISPQDMAFSIDSDNNETTHKFLFNTNTKTPSTAGTTLMSILENGRVGIGTASPANNALHVTGFGNPLRLQGTSSGKVEFGVSTSGDFTIDADDDIRLDAGGQDIALKGAGAEFGRLTNSSQDFVIQNTQNDKDIIFKTVDNTTATEVMRIDGSESRVGIGTTSPDYKLDVRKAGHSVALISGAGNGTYPILHVKDSTDISTALFEGNRAGDQSSRIALWHNPASSHSNSHTALMFQMNDDGNNKTNYAQIVSGIDVITDGSEGGNLQFYTSQAGSLTEQMRIDDAGNVGIGTTAPSYPLHVVQASGDTYGMYLFNSASRGIYFGDTSNNGTGYGKIGGVGGSLFLGSTQIYTSFIGTGDSNTTLGSQGRRWSYFFTRFGQVGYDTSTTTTAQFGISGASDKVPLEVYANGATAPALHVTSGSNVGIGTTSPSQPLHVAAGGTGLAALFTNTSSNGEVVRLTTTGDSRNLYLQTDHVYSNGTIYFGDNSYGTNFRGSSYDFANGNMTMAGTLGIAGLITASGGLTLPATSDNFTMGSHAVNDILIDGDSYPGSSQDSYLITAKYLNTVSGAIVAAGGGGTIGGSITVNQVAVGASTANSIEGNANFTYNGTIVDINGNLRVQDSHTLAAGDSDDLYLYHDGNSTIRSNTGVMNIVQNAAANLVMSTNSNGNQLVLSQSDGNVGIGTAAPSTALDVIGAIKNSSYIHQDADSSSTGVIVGAGGDANVSYDGTDMKINSQRVGSGDLHINATGGNVGIGTTSPARKFEVNYGASSGYMRIVGQSKSLLIGQDSVGASVYQEDNAPLYFATNNTTRMTIAAGGNVGIGTGSPSYKLDVFGGARVKGTASHQTLELRGDTNYGAYINYVRNNGSYAFRTGMITNGSRWDITDYQGAGYEALSVDTNLRVGINNTSPTQPLDVITGDGVVIRRENTDSAIYGPSIYVQRKRATGGDLSSGDLIGNLTFQPYKGDYDNRAATISAAVEGTVGTDITPGRLMFSTAAAGANTVTERMRIDSAGKVGIGTTAPATRLEVMGAGANDYIYVNGTETSASGYTGLHIKKYRPNIRFEDSQNNSNMYIWALGSQLRIGSSAGSSSTAAIVIQSGSANNTVTNTASVQIPNMLKVGAFDPLNNGRISVIDTTRPLVLGYDTSNHVGFSVSSGGNLTIDSDTTISGVLSATAKSFNIPHPLYKDKRLVHGSLEGPEHGIYIRGTIETEEKGCLVELPEYWSAMCEDYTVQLTPHGPYTVYIKEKLKDKVMIECSQKKFKFDYYIVGARTDETLEVVQDGE
jgi:hypothetical protein